MARALAKAGADLVLTSRIRDHLLPFETEIKRSPPRRFVELDVRNQSALGNLPKRRGRICHVDILVDNAGCQCPQARARVTWEGLESDS